MTLCRDADNLLHDPVELDWKNIKLPATWADTLDFKKAGDLIKFLRCVFSRKPERVVVDEKLYGLEHIPKYVLQEFHNLPNGNFSKRISRGYITGFDYVMLGEMYAAREFIGRQFSGCQSVLDAGTGGGHTAKVLKQSGITDVCGLDPSPYLLKHAALDSPEIRFFHGVLEQRLFPENRFEGISACFLFHEVPPRYGKKALEEAFRILKPGSKLVICEPSSIQLNATWLQAFKLSGFKGLYFKWLARSVNEPFLNAWHAFANHTEFMSIGFDIVDDIDEIPIRRIILRKPEETC